MDSNLTNYQQQQLHQKDELLVQLGLAYQDLLRKNQEQQKLLTQMSQELMSLKSAKKSVSEELKMIEWIRDMYDLSNGGKRRLASKASPKTTYNTKSNRDWIDRAVELIIRLKIAIPSKTGSLYALVSKGEAELKLQNYFNSKRREIGTISKR